MKLSDKLCLYEICVSISIFIAIAVILELYAAKNESKQAEDVTRLLQKELVGNIDTRLYSVEQNVKRTVKELPYFSVSTIKNKSGEFLQILIDNDSIILGCGIVMVPDKIPDSREWMEYIHRSSNSIERLQLGGTDYDYTSKQWYTAALNSDNGVWSEPYVDKGAGESLMVTYACPVKSADGNTFCVVTADVAISFLDEQLNRLIPYPESYSFILTRGGKFLEGYPMNPYRDEDREKRKKLDLLAISSSLQTGKTDVMFGSDFICTFTPVENIDLVLCTASPLSSVVSVTSRIRIPLFIILVSGFVILIILLRETLRRALRPLNGLTEAAVCIGEGDFNTRIPEASEYSDLDHLGRAMTDMRDSIVRYVAEIEESTRERERLEIQLHIARDIQRSLLPAGEAEFKGIQNRILSLSAYQESAMEVGGDLYDYVQTEGRLYFIIADVSGKGIPAALMMCYVKSLFHFAAQQGLSPADIVGRINNNMCTDNSSNMFVTMLVGYIDPDLQRMVIANAGHNPAVVCTPESCRYLDLPAGLPVGVMSDMIYTETDCIFSDGYTLFLYTDGMSEAENSHGEFYGQEKLLNRVSEAVTTLFAPSVVVSSLAEELRLYCDNVYSDDITMLCISVSTQSEISMSLKYEIPEIEMLLSEIGNISSREGWNDHLQNNVMLVAEEAVSNVINYSHPANPIDRIDFRLLYAGNVAEIVISDTGNAFNPLDNEPEVNTDSPLEQRKVGGLGIFLIRQLSEKVEYARAGDRNILKITIKE